MPPQLKRILPLFAVFVFLFLVARYLLVPDSFYEKGHYRFNSVSDNQNKELHYGGKDLCSECHEEYLGYLQSDLHADLSCETCHGPGLAHSELEDAASITIDREREFCGLCHSKNASRKAKVVTQVDLSDHNIGQKCIECHNPHIPWEIEE